MLFQPPSRYPHPVSPPHPLHDISSKLGQTEELDKTNKVVFLLVLLVLRRHAAKKIHAGESFDLLELFD